MVSTRLCSFCVCQLGTKEDLNEVGGLEIGRREQHFRAAVGLIRQLLVALRERLERGPPFPAGEHPCGHSHGETRKEPALKRLENPYHAFDNRLPREKGGGALTEIRLGYRIRPAYCYRGIEANI